MKFYATTTSERASKGQGGENLEIEIKGEDKRTFIEAKVFEKDGEYIFEGYVIHPEDAQGHRSEQYFRFEIGKGKSQKDEKKCAYCEKDRGHFHSIKSLTS